jgi:hypothetical protein
MRRLSSKEVAARETATETKMIHNAECLPPSSFDPELGCRRRECLQRWRCLESGLDNDRSIIVDDESFEQLVDCLATAIQSGMLLQQSLMEVQGTGKMAIK